MHPAKKIIITLLLISSSFSGHCAPSTNLKKQKMMEDLDVIEQTFDTMYAPAQWKKNHLRWDLVEEMHNAKLEIHNKENITTKDFQRIVKRIFDSTQDYHVSAHFYSLEAALLPFQVRGAEERYFIHDLYEHYHDFLVSGSGSENHIPILDGDELISIDGKRPHERIQKLVEKEFGPGQTETDYALAENFLTFRTGQLGHNIPKGGIAKLEIKNQESGKTNTYRMYWAYRPEEVQDLLVKAVPEKKALYDKQMISPLYETYKSSYAQAKKRLLPEVDNEEEVTSQNQSKLPDLGEVVWEAPKHYGFHAYIFERPEGKKVGFVRIPNYYPAPDNEGFEKFTNHFAKIISKFENETDGLVIDQLDNPGGSVFYVYALASMLSDQPLSVPKHKMAITQAEIYEAVLDLYDYENIKNDKEARETFGAKTLTGYPVDYDLIQSFISYFKFILNEWKHGRTITNSDYLYGIDYLKPYPNANYTKPILLLVNSLDFSGGDFFPAILQDNNRVTLMGSQTAGAGGYVLPHQFYNHNGIAYFSVTASIAERDNGNPIENLGVKPDIPYSLTVDDICHQHRDYVKAIHKEIDKLMN